ncbi:MAG: MFS transporter [Dehalococcoidia bacterium]|nr:MFS transporter [Dehalococcoidia bacterium]
MRPPRKIFFGWWIVAAGAGIQMLVGGLMMQSFGVYVTAIEREFGWSRAVLAGAFSLSRAESGIFGPLQGWMIDRFGPRAVMRVGLVIFALGFFAFSQLNSIVTFYIAFALMAVGSSLGGFLSITVALINWFNKRRARALGISQTGFAIGGLLTPLIVLSLNNLGWRETAFASGILVLLLGLPLTHFIRHRPEDYGYTVDGLPEEPEEDDYATDEGTGGASRPNGSSRPVDFTAKEAMRTRSFWLISLGHASALLVVSAVMVHLFLHLTDSLGYSDGTAAGVIALMTAMQIVGQTAGASLGDWVSKRLIVVGCMAMHAAGLLLVAYATTLWMVVAFAVLHGLAWGTRGPLMQAMRADYFGRASFGTIMGFSSMIVMWGMMTGPIVAGFLYDRTQSYELGFTVLAAFAALGSVYFVLATKPAAPARVAAQAAERRAAALVSSGGGGGSGGAG